MPRFYHYLQLMRLHRPIGILLLLWPTLWALWLANQGHPAIKLVLIFVAGVIVMRSAGCIINDYADRYFDRHVSRTQNRPLTSGMIKPRAALYLFGSLIILALLLVLNLNRLTIFLAVIGLVLAIIYPYTKRYINWPQFILGLAFAWAIPMVYAASQNTIPAVAWLLFTSAVLWPLAYDTMYAMADREDDRKIGLKSTAILFGKYDCAIIAIIQLSMILLLIWLGQLHELHWPFYSSLLIAAGLFVYQQYLLRLGQPKKYLQAFLNNQWVGLVIFLGVLGSYLIN